MPLDGLIVSRVITKFDVGGYQQFREIGTRDEDKAS